MKEILSPSLLPYLQANENQVRLEISLVSRDHSFLEKSPYPFLLIDESTPFERLLKAEIKTAAGSRLASVFLLQQADRYRHSADGMWPLTNLDIDQRWQSAIEEYASQIKTDHPGSMLLSEPIRDNEAYLPFQPLFYCGFKNVFFHPPCPQCGDLLDLCRDDLLLTESGLSPYSASLRRYLYCPNCQLESGTSQFYVYARRGDDPAYLKDRRDLINDFGRLILKSDSANGFPCMACPELSECYGADSRVMSRIVPFSFYPFHMILFKADTLRAPDFLALVSGAGLEALEANQPAGRRHGLHLYEQLQDAPSAFLFDSDSDLNFLEILYLKLSFLGELIAKFYSSSKQGVYCDASLSLDRVWIRMTDQAGQLPQFWNFSLSIIDLWSDDLIQRPHLTKYPPAYGHHFLGNIWFYALLVNERQSIGAVRAELDKLLPMLTDHDQALSDIMSTGVAGTVFVPENIYWRPHTKQVSENRQALWNRSLDLGGAILAAGFRTGHSGSAVKFWPEFNALRADIKTALFGSTQDFSATAAENQAIAAVLSRLLDKWRREVQPVETSLPDENADTIILGGQQNAEDLAKTLILTPEALRTAAGQSDEGKTQPDEEKTLILPPENGPLTPKPEIENESMNDEPLQETVILSPQGRANPPKPDAEASDADSLQETVILSTNSRPNLPRPVTGSADQELIQETVILSPGNAAPKPGRGGVRNAGPTATDLPETVVLSPGGQPAGRSDSMGPENVSENHTTGSRQAGRKDFRLKFGKHKGDDPAQDDDILTETVILRPQKNKGA